MAGLSDAEVREVLEEGYDRHCRPDFIPSDPISIPHSFEKREDREVSGLIAATIAWGARPMILRNARQAMHLMGDEPHRFVMEHSPNDLMGLDGFVHRTFQADDLRWLIRALRRVYSVEGGLEEVFKRGFDEGRGAAAAISGFRSEMLRTPCPPRSRKHVADPGAGSAAKRLNMFLRWMVRDCKRGVDLGLWRGIPASALSCPLDVHSGRVARQLGLLSRRQDDAKAVAELDAALRRFDPADPVRFDFALFGNSVSPS